MSAPLLSLEGIDAFYGPSHVLQEVSLAVPAGQVVSLLGRNGAGKTTTLRTIVGIVRPGAGRVRFAGQDITGQRTHLVARRGIAYVPEDRGIFASLSVREHLELVRPRRAPGESWSKREVFELFPPLAERLSHGGAQLSGGEQQMLAIARALMAGPRLLLLDEPSEGLAPIVIAQIAAALRTLRSKGLSILLVEQSYPLAIRLSDRVYVLGKGRIRWSGAPREIEDAPEIKHTWVGI